MFTGIIEELGKVEAKNKIAEGIQFRVSSKKINKKLKISDSVCVNGVCHTVTAKDAKGFKFISVHETLKKTNMSKLNIGDVVNLENSLVIGQQIGGHFVFGHIDDTGTVASVKQVKQKGKKNKESNNWEYRVKIHKKYSKFIIRAGSIAINGVSLTVAEVRKPNGKHFIIKIAIIPYTHNHTTFKNLKANDKVNLEFDFLGKYVQKVLEKKSLKKRK